MYMFCIAVINKQKYFFERKNWIASSQKDSAFSSLVFLVKECRNRKYVLKHAKNQQKIMLV